MALYTYDPEVDILYVLLVDEHEARVRRTVELSPRVHVDLDPDGGVVGVEICNPRAGTDLAAVNEQFGVAVEVPFSFAA